MGYYVYVIFYISYLNSPLITNGINSLEFYLFLILFLSFYILLVKIFLWKTGCSPRQIGIYKNLFWINVALILSGGFIPSPYSFIVVVPVLMIFFVFLVIN